MVREAEVAGVVRAAIAAGVVRVASPSTPPPPIPSILRRSIAADLLASVDTTAVATCARACCASTLHEAIMITAAAHSRGS